jgi:hypothetical protein
MILFPVLAIVQMLANAPPRVPSPMPLEALNSLDPSMQF